MRSSSMTLAIILLESGCLVFNELPEPAPEIALTACRDGEDNDFDGLTDCEDDSCLGFCPEETREACSDGRDNDSDGQVDTEDARCWRYAATELIRCHSAADDGLVESFDDPAIDPLIATGWTLPSSRYPSFWPPWSGEGRALLRDPATLERSTLASRRVFVSAWPGIELRAALLLLPQEPASDLAIGLVSRGSLPPGGEVAVIAVDGASGTVSLSVTGTTSVRRGVLSGRWYVAVLRATASEVSLDLFPSDGTAAIHVDPIVPTAELEHFSPFELVLRGGGVLLDDISLALPEQQTCGAAMPALVPPSGSRGFDRISIARAAEGTICATAFVCREGPNPLVDPDDRLHGVRLVYRSPDGLTWERVTPPGVSRRGAQLGPGAIAWDPEAERWRMLVVRYSSDGSTSFETSSSSDCREWTPLGGHPATLAPIAAGDPFDVCRDDGLTPSYVIRRPAIDSGFVHELYFTRPKDEVVLGPDLRLRSPLELFRASSIDGLTFTFDEGPLFQFAADVDGPVQIVSVGPRDLAAVFPRVFAGTSPSITVMAAIDDRARSFLPPGVPPRLGAPAGAEVFDSQGLSAASLVVDRGRGLLLYGALPADDPRAGLAVFAVESMIQP